VTGAHSSGYFLMDKQPETRAMNRRLMLLAFTIISAAVCESTSEPPGTQLDPGVAFTANGGSRYSASGTPQSQVPLSGEFAVGQPDSVGGFAIVSLEVTQTGSHGNLFVMQANPRQTGTFECGEPGQSACHGRYIVGVRDGATSNYDRWFTLVEGTLTITQFGPDRVKGTFTGTFEANDNQPNPSFNVQDGAIDVPYVNDEVTSGAVGCLLSLIGVGNGSCP
jgi:hypothetical protein